MAAPGTQPLGDGIKSGPKREGGSTRPSSLRPYPPGLSNPPGPAIGAPEGFSHGRRRPPLFDLEFPSLLLPPQRRSRRPHGAIDLRRPERKASRLFGFHLQRAP